ncbi:MAG: hypothetical protein V7637_614 [Mycobacteriales bacterium]
MSVAVQAPPDADAAELILLVAALRDELLATDVERVELASAGVPPAGATALDVIAAGRLVVEFVRSAQRVRAVVAAVGRWVALRQARSVKIEIDGDVLEVTGVSVADQRALMDIWIARHGGPPDAA